MAPVYMFKLVTNSTTGIDGISIGQLFGRVFGQEIESNPWEEQGEYVPDTYWAALTDADALVLKSHGLFDRVDAILDKEGNRIGGFPERPYRSTPYRRDIEDAAWPKYARLLDRLGV